MVLKVAIQMDPIESIDIGGDSTFALGLEAQKRGFELYYYLPENMSLRDGAVTARIRSLALKDKSEDYFSAGPEEVRHLTDMDVVLMRQDPPFDMAYISATHMLEQICDHTLVVNNPVAVRNGPEKILPVLFPSLQPPTLLTRDLNALEDFREEFGDIILKPVYGNGGAGVFRVKEQDENFSALVEMFMVSSREPIVAQQYLPDVRQGDKRVILVEGEAVASVNRIPQPGEARANVHVGGRPEASELSDRDIEIAKTIGSYLKDNGIVFAGIDVIGDYLTEINVTSPTCIREIAEFGGPNVAKLIWDAIEVRLKR